MFSAQSLNWLNQSLGLSRRTDRPCPQDSRVKWTWWKKEKKKKWLDLLWQSLVVHKTQDWSEPPHQVVWPSRTSTRPCRRPRCPHLKNVISYVTLHSIIYHITNFIYLRRPEQKQERLRHWGSPWDRQCHRFTFSFLILTLTIVVCDTWGQWSQVSESRQLWDNQACLPRYRGAMSSGCSHQPPGSTCPPPSRSWAPCPCPTCPACHPLPRSLASCRSRLLLDILWLRLARTEQRLQIRPPLSAGRW